MHEGLGLNWGLSLASIGWPIPTCRLSISVTSGFSSVMVLFLRTTTTAATNYHDDRYSLPPLLLQALLLTFRSGSSRRPRRTPEIEIL